MLVDTMAGVAKGITGGLTGRLAVVATLAGRGTTVADIGSDHGLVPLALLHEQRFTRAIAIELTDGPLAAVTQSMERADVLQTMQARKGDGFHPLSPCEADVVVIAGMGGGTIWGILTSEWARTVLAARPPRLVLQPMANSAILRFFAQRSGYAITADMRVKEGDVIYECLRLEYTPAFDAGAQALSVNRFPRSEDRDAFDAMTAEQRMYLACGELPLRAGCQHVAQQISQEIAKRQMMMKELAYPRSDRAVDRLRQVREEYGALLRLQEERSSQS